MTTPPPHDPQCRALAEHVLQDEPCTQDPELHELYVRELTIAIENCVDTFLFTQIIGPTARMDIE